MIRRRRLAGLLGLIGLSLGAAYASAQEAGNARAGLALARRICTECHAVERRQAYSPNPFAPHFEYVANVPGMTPIALTVALQRSHRTMPNIILTPKETRDVVRYILSLQRAN